MAHYRSIFFITYFKYFPYIHNRKNYWKRFARSTTLPMDARSMLFRKKNWGRCKNNYN